MNEQQISTVLMIAELGSITKASSELFLSTQGVKSRVDSLEHELGCALFERSSTGMMLTESGKVFAEKAPALLEQINIFSHAVTNPGGKNDVLRISIWPNKKIPVLDAMCLEFSRQYPDIAISFVVATKSGMLENIYDGTADISFLSGYPCPPELHFSLIKGLFLSHNCVMHVDHPLAKLDVAQLSFDALREFRIALLAPAIPDTFKHIGVEQLLPFDIYEVMNCCRRGFVCICDEYFDVDNPQLVSKPLEESTLQIGCHHKPNPSKMILDFIRVAGEVATLASQKGEV